MADHSVQVVTDPVSELLLRWRDLRDQGTPRNAEELAADHPELLGELRQRLRAIEAMEAALGVGAATETAEVHPDSDFDLAPEALDLPGYEMIGLIGRGGMGAVYKARQISLNRLVAIKMILSGADASPEQRARFRAEAEAVARLHHPNVVQIHEVGEHAGRLFYSMELIEGGSLENRLAHSVLAPSMAADLTETLAGAVAVAHAQGIVHRDLKPANILLQSGEGREAGDEAAESTLLASRPSPHARLAKIADFGLAKRLDGPGGNTRLGAVMGTPSYMAPEQAEGKNQIIGPAVDIYALGAILYECLTGRPPFQGESTLDTLEQVRLREPVPPSRLQPRVPRDLETICLKCLEKVPAQRYPSAAALLEDLQRFRDGKPIVARPSSVWNRSIKWAKRKPALAGLLTVSALAAVALLSMWIYFTLALRDQVKYAQTEAANSRTSQQMAIASQKDAEKQRNEARAGWAAADVERQHAQREAHRAETLLLRFLSTIDEYAKATENAKLQMLQIGEPGTILFGLAKFFAQSAATFQKDTELPEADRGRFAEQYAARAVKLLQSAAQAGYFGPMNNLKKLKEDHGLDPLRSRRDFAEMLTGLDRKRRP